jgi:peptidoglycan/xylan/chitin deacetylase (PgdA/CDA1 family)
MKSTAYLRVRPSNCVLLIVAVMSVSGMVNAQANQRDRIPFAPPSLVLKDPPRADAVLPRLLVHGLRQKKVVALTFDACATRAPSAYDGRITDILMETKTPATFFLGGKWMEDHPGQTKFLAGIPIFQLGNHTYLHPHLLALPEARIRQELSWTQKVMFSLTGTQASVFRAPYGEIDDRVVRIAASMGLSAVQYDLASGDPDSTISRQRLVEYVSSMARNGSIIVMHINGRGWHTAEALPEILERLKKRGFTFVTIRDLLAATDPPAAPK